jgi:hypothetical protein
MQERSRVTATTEEPAPEHPLSETHQMVSLLKIVILISY